MLLLVVGFRLEGYMEVWPFNTRGWRTCGPLRRRMCVVYAGRSARRIWRNPAACMALPQLTARGICSRGARGTARIAL